MNVFFSKIGQFEDDRYLSRLQTLLAQYPPVQVSLICFDEEYIDSFANRFSVKKIKSPKKRRKC